jgi:nucleoside-diphosphate-sugar epimerase
MARYLVTGAAGFIASRVSEMLLEEGHQVVGVDNLNHSYDVRLKEYRLKRLKKAPGFTFYQQDICNLKELEPIFGEGEPFTAVFNLAARAGVRASVEDPWAFIDTNVNGTLNLLSLCQRFGVPKFLLASTSSVYANCKEFPYREDAFTDRPLTAYAASKKAAEGLAYSYHHLYGLDVTVYRYFTVFGPAGRPDMSLFRFTQWISEGKPVMVTGDGNQSRDFTYVDDIARGTIAGRKLLGYEVINLGNDSPHPMMEAIHILEEKIGRKANLVFAPIPKADMLATRASIEKARILLGWQPQVSLEDGLGRLVDWYNAERSWASQIATP